MIELIVCSAIVLVALTAEYIRWLLKPTAEYPVWRSVLWFICGLLGYLMWIGIPATGLALLMIGINVTIGLLVVVQVVDWWIWWRSQRRADAKLEEVLLAFARECPDPDYGDLECWCAKYPQFEAQITIAAIARNADLMPELEPLQQGV